MTSRMVPVSAAEIAQKRGFVWALGAMSGTSLDGVDAAMVLTDGDTIMRFGQHNFRPYSEAEQEVLRAALGHWPGTAGVEAAQKVVEAAHIELLSQFMDAQMVGFHGQTLAHDPYGQHGPPRTHQVGNGQAIAHALGLPCVWDFRSADVALGGQGAPLAPFFHFACADWIGADAPFAFLNLGGVGNLTYVDPRKDAATDEGAVLAFDTGPANAPVNDLMMARRGVAFDEDGACAAGGKPDAGRVRTFLSNPYFLKMPPKSLDRDSFSELPKLVEDLSDADAAATLLACSAAAVARGMEHMPSPVSKILVTGGGRKNPIFMKYLQRIVDVELVDIDYSGLDGDMLEAQAFAYLAVRVSRGLPTSGPSTTGVSAHVSGGTLSLPEQALEQDPDQGLEQGLEQS